MEADGIEASTAQVERSPGELPPSVMSQMRLLIESLFPGSRVVRLASPAPRLPSCVTSAQLPIRLWIDTASNERVEVVMTISSVTR